MTISSGGEAMEEQKLLNAARNQMKNNGGTV